MARTPRRARMRITARSPGALLIAAAVLVTLAACGGGTSSSPTFQDCGVEDQQMGTNLNADGRRCLLAAFEAGRPAQFVSRLTTVEGAPIIRTFRVHSATLVEVEWDNRDDPFGSGKIDVLHCPRLVPVADWNQAMSDEMRAEEVFVEDGCQQVGTR